MNGPFKSIADGHTSIKLKKKGQFNVGALRIWAFYPCPRGNKELIWWLDHHHFRLTPLRTRPAITSHPFPCHQATVALSSHGPGLSCGFIIDRDGKQNHHRMKDGEKGGKKNSYKIHADLQIEKVRERKEEDSPLTKPCTHRILHHPSNNKKRQQQKQTKKTAEHH